MPLFGRKKPVETPMPVREREPLPAPPEPDSRGLRSMAAHRDYLLSCVVELPPFRQQVIDSLGLALCEDVSSTINLPRFDNSAMDGYAVRAVDVLRAEPERPAVLPVVGEIPAGQPAPHPLSPGTAMKIMTGAVLPECADAIVPYENTDRGTGEVRVFAPSRAGQHIRRTGEDIEAGTLLLSAGQQIGPRDIALLAAIGRDTVLVRPRARVVVVATGSELVDPGTPLAREQQIYDSNSYLLAAAARAAGAQVFRIGRVGDEGADLKELISDQLIRADLIVTTGGVSQGDYDIVKAVMPELGECDFAEVAMQPGKPQGFGLIGDDRIPTIMLPGNPVSTFVSFEAFVRPAIRKLMGLQPYVRPALKLPAARDLRSTPGKLQLARGVVRTDADSGAQVVDLAGGHGSHLLGDLARAEVLVLLPEEADSIAAGELVEVWPLDGSGGWCHG